MIEITKAYETDVSRLFWLFEMWFCLIGQKLLSMTFTIKFLSNRTWEGSHNQLTLYLTHSLYETSLID